MWTFTLYAVLGVLSFVQDHEKGWQGQIWRKKTRRGPNRLDSLGLYMVFLESVRKIVWPRDVEVWMMKVAKPGLAAW